MRVKQTHPKFARYVLDFAQQGRKREPARGINRLARPGFFLPQIHAVVGRVLADEINFLHALRDERAHFRENRGRRAAAMASAHLRNDAETARMIAAFRDFQIRAVRWRETEARRVVIRDVSWAARDEIERIGFRRGRRRRQDAVCDGAQFRHLIESDERVHFR